MKKENKGINEKKKKMIGYKARKEGERGGKQNEGVTCVMKRRRISQETKKVPQPDGMLLHLKACHSNFPVILFPLFRAFLSLCIHSIRRL